MISLQVHCPALLPRAVYVVQSAGDEPARCWLVPLTRAGAAVDWARRRVVPMPQPARLGPRALDGGPLVRSIRAVFSA